MRTIDFAIGEHYHVWNRAVDKRNIFRSNDDLERFMLGIEQFNTPKILGELRRGHRVSTDPRLVEIVAYSISQNHFHFILEQIDDRGIEKFMHKLSMGYSKYFNKKYRRSGALFEGKFKAKHIGSNEYLLHLSAYINLNNLAHGRGHAMSIFSKSSWDEYVSPTFVTIELCKKNIVLEQFKDIKSYRKFAEGTLAEIIKRKEQLKQLEDLDIELVNTI
jgi:putative transposase